MRLIKYMNMLLLTMIMIILLFSSSVSAQQSDDNVKRVVKVAYPEQTNLTEIDSNGNYSGYSYDYINKIAEFANWDLQYISYSGMEINDQLVTGMQMVESGEADLIGAVLYNSALQEKYIYPEQNYGVVYTTLEVLDNNFNITETNFMQMECLHIAVIRTAVSRNSELDGFVNAANANCEYIYCDSVEEQLQCLNSGKADAMLNVSLTFLPGLKQIAQFAPRPYYFVSGQGNEDLIKELDDAIQKINLTDPYFESTLRYEYFNDTNADMVLSEVEKAYINSNNTMQVLIIPAYAPFAFVNKKGEACGMTVSVLNRIGTEVGIEFQYHILQEGENISEQITSGKYNVVVGPPQTNAFAANYSLALSSYYIETSLTMFNNKDSESKDKSECVLALMQDVPETLSYQYSEIRYYDNIEQCLEAVNRGEADYGYASGYVVDFYTSQHSYKNLGYLDLSGYNRKFGFYVPNTEDTQLLAIINKYIRNMPTEDVHKYLSLALSQKDSGGIKAIIENNPTLVTIYSSIMIFLFVLITLSSIYTHLIKEKNEKLNTALNAKSEFLSRMSHDMRTPMNGIIGLTGLSLDIENLPEEAADNLSKIDESAHFLLSLINDTLDMNRIENGKLILNKEVVSLQAFFEQTISIIRPNADQKHLTLIVSQSQGEFPKVYLDKVRLQQVYLNIISNAVKFTHEHGRIELRCEYKLIDNKQVNTNIVIKDNGIGIDKKFIERIFEPFEQENDSTTANYMGSGLGLSIAKNIVDAMGGTVSCQSEKGVGTQFNVNITFDIADEQENAISQSDISYEVLKDKRILLCEDNNINAQIAIKLLQNKGIEVERAVNGLDGVDLFRKNEPYYYDAILMDIRMPVMDGLTAAKAIREMNKADSKSVPIIAMTANAFAEDIEKSFAAGINSHIAKPIVTEYLYKTIYEQINGTLSERGKM